MDAIFAERRYLIPFRSSLLPQIFTDTLVIGAGAAGLRAAIAAREHGEVIVLAKGDLKSTNTAWAQGGVAAAWDEADTPGDHVRDTLEAGAGLCDADAVGLIAGAARARIEELLSWGMRFDRDGAGRVLLGREGGHGVSRILHAMGDETGRELQRCLTERARSLEGVRLFEQCFALDLITPNGEPGSPVMGAITFHPKHRLQIIWAKATILASGGTGTLYRESTNPPGATADGLAMAYRAGATLADMAFVQFHPTCLYLPGAARALISEAVRGAGAYLLDASGRRFMLDAHPLAELAPRDVVARAIVRQIARQGGSHVLLDCRHIPGVAERFPALAATTARFDLDPAKDLIPVHPAHHYMIGGVRTDLSGRTDVPGLYAAGEAASCGLHGANRLASNSLLEGLVMGEVAGRVCAEMKEPAREGTPPGFGGVGRSAPVPVVSDIRLSDHGELDLADVRSSLRWAVWRNIGIERSGPRLKDVVHMLDFWARYTLDKIFDDPEGWEVQNMLLVASLVARSALWREESRGSHTRTDFPSTESRFAVHDLWRRGREGPLEREVRA
ncbi:MAG: L-aspartate oxidase [Phycisphaeraceae bacterium]|nr:MAG: L-aspartate oxidase [Phycisphaeraceae bacterium]